MVDTRPDIHDLAGWCQYLAACRANAQYVNWPAEEEELAWLIAAHTEQLILKNQQDREQLSQAFARDTDKLRAQLFRARSGARSALDAIRSSRRKLRDAREIMGRIGE